MTASPASPPRTPTPDPASVRHAVEHILDDFLATKARAADDAGLPGEIAEVLRGFVLSGGKRLRPVLCTLGWHAADAHTDTPPPPVLKAAASLELFHAFALVHDDLIDRSDTRRGRPTMHRTLAARHRLARGPAEAERLGTDTAILVGDLALAWSDELLHTAGLAPARLDAALAVVDRMRTEVMYGQYLDVAATGTPTDDVDAALRVAHYKTARYTIERPLHLGAALAPAPPPGLTEALTAYALPLGEAFQLRDDLLGVYGTPDLTGKSALEDLREGKATVLIALALRRAAPRGRAVLRSLLADPDLNEDGAATVRAVLDLTGAHRTVEDMIDTRRRDAVHAVESGPFTPPVAATLRDLADQATRRDI
ncbi:geranylgeranyl diphosphate synthase [Embleya scabrispora]|uniref:Geranylgeranyl diphosphate synthase n=1 Tax=Embleya scabrispora TaxID=159449 RepID=A0A1T3P6R6_9ACTN|nr:polyprenyl synthetase family protein [Embleya scabrispora]OPC84692.1 geranylgeranyl diphosphate synthase [Embleya scabrispora]